MSEEPKLHPLVQKMAEQIHNPTPGDDKSNINNYIFDLELPNDTPGAIVMKTYALENIGQMALRYDAEFLMICGVLPHMKKCLYNSNDQVIAATARACSFIAQSGGAQALLDEGFSLILMGIATDLNKKFYVRDACTRAFGWLHVMRTIESKH